MKNKKSREKANKTKNWLFEKTGKINKTLARQNKKKERRHKLLISDMKEETSLSPMRTKRKINIINNSMTTNFINII